MDLQQCGNDAHLPQTVGDGYMQLPDAQIIDA
jgi:hypothetical protein